MMKKALLQKYNQKDTLLVVSIYPPKGTIHGKKVGGVASFTKNTLTNLEKVKHGKIVVLAEIINKPEIYEEDNMLIIRCWKRNSLGLYAHLMSYIKQFDNVSQLIIEFEFALYGDFFVAGFFPIFLFAMKLLGKQTVTVVHQVLTDVNSLSGHIGLTKNSILTRLFGSMLKMYYRLLVVFSSHIIVLEQDLAKRLIKLGNHAQKITAIPHGVDTTVTSINSNQAKKNLGIDSNTFVIVVFGFLTWYKGSDLAVNAVRKVQQAYPNKKIQLILAGGESLTQGDKSHYKNYISRLKKMVSETEHVHITGYVPQEEFVNYFSAADVVLLPYRAFMSSSGILSLALSYSRPIIFSSVLKNWFGRDARNNKSLLFVKPTSESIAHVIGECVTNKRNLKHIEGMVGKIRQERDYATMALHYQELLNSLKAQSETAVASTLATR